MKNTSQKLLCPIKKNLLLQRNPIHLHKCEKAGETLIKGWFLGFHNPTAPSLSLATSLHCISCSLEHYLVAMQPDDKEHSLKGAQTAVFLECLCAEWMTWKLSGEDQIQFHLFWHFVCQQVDFSPRCFSFEISFISLPPLTVLTRAHCKPLPLLRKQQQRHSINGRMHTGVRPGEENKHFFFLWCFQELRRAFLPSEIFDKLPEALHRQSKINECRPTAEIASKAPPLGILSLLWCRVAVVAAELDSLQIIIHIHTYRQFGISR